MADDRCYVQPGDLIQIQRQFYEHWALYVGKGYVIHVTDQGAPSVLGSSSSVSARRAKVKKQLLMKVAGNDRWCVNNKYDRSRTPLPVKEIIQHAEQWIDREVAYDVLGSNCEHFVTMLRYGDPVSDQATTALVSSTTGAVAGIVAGVATALGTPAAVGILGSAAAVVVTTLSKGMYRT